MKTWWQEIIARPILNNVNISADEVSSVPSSMPDLGPDPNKFLNYSRGWDIMYIFDDKSLKKLKNPPPEVIEKPNIKDL
jgi:hypothetical protein